MKRENTQRDRPSLTRVIGYEFETWSNLETVTDEILGKELDREGTPLTQYEARGRFLWLNGAPGAELRKILTRLEGLGWRRRPHE